MTEPRALVNGRMVGLAGELAVTRKDTGERIATAPLAGEDDVRRAADAAVAAFAQTRALSGDQRAESLRRLRDGVAARRNAFAETVAKEAGKPIKQARTEVERALHTIATGAEEATRIGGEVIPLDAVAHARGRLGLLRRFPVGPVVGITPFNFPLNLVCHKVVPALASGCPIVLKPASATPLSALLLGEALADAGIPDGAVNVIPCRSSDAEPLVSDPRFELLTFTGSAEVGWKLRERAGRKRVALELGGNAAVVVHDDADLDRAALKVAGAGFSYAGQSCISVQRVLVQERVLEGFRERLLAEVGKLVVGDVMEERTDVGPLIDEDAARKAESWIRRAVDAGARLHCGGDRDGAFVSPAVLEGVSRDEPLWCEEAFAPVVVLASYRTWEEAIGLVNDSAYGLQAGIFTRDLPRVFAAWSEIVVGGLMVNDVPTWRVDHMPYGGVKASGLGREGVRWAIEHMTEPRLLAIDLG